MVMATLAGANVIYSAVKAALNEEIPEFNIKWGVKFLRYWGGVCVIKNEKILEI
jgi:carbamoyl-phosphate synthase large subunit